jgi:hypothetical protein
MALKSYAVSSKVVLQCGVSLQELVLSNRVQLVWVPGSLDTVVSMEMRKPTHLQGWDQCCFCGGSESGCLNHTAPHGACRLLVANVAEKTQFRLGEILTKAT